MSWEGIGAVQDSPRSGKDCSAASSSCGGRNSRTGKSGIDSGDEKSSYSEGLFESAPDDQALWLADIQQCAPIPAIQVRGVLRWLRAAGEPRHARLRDTAPQAGTFAAPSGVWNSTVSAQSLGVPAQATSSSSRKT